LDALLKSSHVLSAQGITGKGWFDTRSTMKGIFDYNLRLQAHADTQIEYQNVCKTDIDIRNLKELLVAVFKEHTAKLGVNFAQGYDVYVARVEEAGRKVIWERAIAPSDCVDGVAPVNDAGLGTVQAAAADADAAGPSEDAHASDAHDGRQRKRTGAPVDCKCAKLLNMIEQNLTHALSTEESLRTCVFQRAKVPFEPNICVHSRNIYCQLTNLAL
jgi:hypothetical protein